FAPSGPGDRRFRRRGWGFWSRRFPRFTGHGFRCSFGLLDASIDSPSDPAATPRTMARKDSRVRRRDGGGGTLERRIGGGGLFPAGWKAGVGALEHALEVGREFVDHGSVAFGQIFLLAGVTLEVEDLDAVVFVPMDEFPGPFEDGGLGTEEGDPFVVDAGDLGDFIPAALAVVVGKMEEHRPGHGDGAGIVLEQGEEADAVESD